MAPDDRALDDRTVEDGGRRTGESDRPSKGGAILDWFSTRLNLTEIFSLLTSYGLFYAELDNTKGIRRAFAEALDRPTASAARWPRVLSLIVVLLIGLLILTGGCAILTANRNRWLGASWNVRRSNRCCPV